MLHRQFRHDRDPGRGGRRVTRTSKMVRNSWAERHANLPVEVGQLHMGLFAPSPLVGDGSFSWRGEAEPRERGRGVHRRESRLVGVEAGCAGEGIAVISDFGLARAAGFAAGIGQCLARYPSPFRRRRLGRFAPCDANAESPPPQGGRGRIIPYAIALPLPGEGEGLEPRTSRYCFAEYDRQTRQRSPSLSRSRRGASGGEVPVPSPA
jgi:hypothetical protein